MTPDNAAIRRRRLEMGLTTLALAERIQRSQNTIIKLEREGPTALTVASETLMYQLARALEIPVTEITLRDAA